MMNCKDLEGNSSGLIKVLTQHLPAATVGIHKPPSISIAGVPADIQIDHLPNTNQKHYQYTNLFGPKCLYAHMDYMVS
jgi:hypothetical protein